VKSLLVTGASGLLGSNLVRLTADRYHVTGVMTGRHARLAPGKFPCAILLADLTRPDQAERVIESAQPDFVIHCAAMTDVDGCEAVSEEAECMNSFLPGLLAKAAAKSGARFLHISTDSVFDGEHGGYTEEDQPKPANVYARTKLEGEQNVFAAYPEALVGRVNFYGWSWQGRRSLAEWFYNHLSAGKRVPGFTDLHFCPLLANDLVEILLKMLEKNLSGLYHVVSPESQSKYDFGRMLAREFGFDEGLVTPASYLDAGLKAQRSRWLNLSSAKLARALGEDLPAQLPAVRRFVDLHRQGYSQSMREMFVGPDSMAVVG
jgi:dTDP-4-dehydrorhamnose reductase